MVIFGVENNHLERGISAVGQRSSDTISGESLSAMKEIG